MTNDDCGSGAGCLYKEAMIDTLTERVRVLREALQGVLDPFHEGQVVALSKASGYVQAAVSAGEHALEATK